MNLNKYQLSWLGYLNQIGLVSVCAKYQLSSWSRSDWKVCAWWGGVGWGGVVGYTWQLCLTPTLVALELGWVGLSCVGFWQKFLEFIQKCITFAKLSPSQIQSQFVWTTEKALSLLNTNDHLGSATNPPPGIVRGKGPTSVKLYGEVSFNKHNTIRGNCQI